MRIYVLLLLTALISAGCLGNDFADSIEGSWELTSASVDGEEIVLVPSHPVTMTFKGNEVNGTASCNGYGGTFERDGSSIAFGNLAMTEMACAPPGTMTAEAMFASGLAGVERVEVDGGLTLSGPGVELVFELLEPVPDAELTNTVWVLDALILGDAVSSVGPARATLEFFSDGSVLGDTGCRGFSGQYAINGAEVVVTELASDGHQCEPDMIDQDNHVMSVLEGGFRVEIDGPRLTLLASGDEGLTYLADQ